MIFFFDLDGPILDVSEKYYRAYADSLKELGRTALDKGEYWNLKRLKISDYVILSKTFSEHLLDEFMIRRNQLIEERELLKLDYVWPELRDTYQALFSKTPTVLVTLRTYSDRTSWQLKNFGIYSWFYAILSHPASGISERWQVKVNLIEESGFLKKVSAEDCVFVGDTETDILAGKKLGMKTVGVSFGIRVKELLLPSKPDLIFDTPMELSTYLRGAYL